VLRRAPQKAAVKLGAALSFTKAAPGGGRGKAAQAGGEARLWCVDAQGQALGSLDVRQLLTQQQEQEQQQLEQGGGQGEGRGAQGEGRGAQEQQQPSSSGGGGGGGVQLLQQLLAGRLEAGLAEVRALRFAPGSAGGDGARAVRGVTVRLRAAA
jgi:hypothetical protein